MLENNFFLIHQALKGKIQIIQNKLIEVLNNNKKLKITNGEIIKIFNSRGSCLARSLLTDNIREKVISLPTGAWFETDNHGLEKQGNPNVLTFDKGTSRLGQGPSAHTSLVNIKKID